MITQQNLVKAIEALNDSVPTMSDVKLGNLLFAMMAAHNQFKADFNALKAKYAALLAHLDTANVAGTGNGNAAAFGAATSTASAPLIGSRGIRRAAWPSWTVRGVLEPCASVLRSGMFRRAITTAALITAATLAGCAGGGSQALSGGDPANGSGSSSPPSINYHGAPYNLEFGG